MEHVRSHLNLLGLEVEDKVTGTTGIVTSVCFDLYGCIQALINYKVEKEGHSVSCGWYDVSRLKILNTLPVMEKPNYHYGPVAAGKQGSANKQYYAEKPTRN